MSKPSRLSEEIVFLPEVLDDHGYETAGIVSNINLAQSFGFDQGYDEYYYLGPDYLIGAKESSSKLIIYQIARSVILKLTSGQQRFNDFLAVLLLPANHFSRSARGMPSSRSVSDSSWSALP